MRVAPVVSSAFLFASSFLLAPPGAIPAVLDRFDFAKPSARFELEPKLREISGLAVTKDGRLFAHDDERATLHQLDLGTGKIVTSFSMGERKPVKGDFEGLAIVDDRFYLTTSDGDLHVSGEGRNGTVVPYEVVRTGLGKRCEIEGLAYEPSGRVLLFGCKTPRVRELRKTVTIFRWALDQGGLAEPPMIQLPGGDLAPSDLALDPSTGHCVLVAAKQGVLVELTSKGVVVAVKQLDRARHRQAEGITFLPDGSLAISDEGGGGNGTLALYRPVR